MRKIHFNSLASSRFLVIIAIAILFLLGVLQVAQGFIDTKDYSENILSAIRERTGKEAVIKGKVTVTLLPRPTIHIPNIDLHDPRDTYAPSANVELVEITSSLLSMFSEKPEITAISLQRPTLELQRDKEGVMRWDWFNYGLFRNAAGAAGNISLDINDGKLLYRDNAAQQESAANAINLSGVLSQSPDMQATLEYAGHALQMSVTTGDTQAGGAIPIVASLTVNDSNHFSLDGTLNFLEDHFQLAGKLEASIADVLSWKKAEGENQSVFDRLITGRSGSDADQALSLPVRFTAELNHDSQATLLNNLDLSASDANGKGSMSIAWDSKPVIDLKLALENLDYTKWDLLFGKIGAMTRKSSPGVYSSDEEEGKNPIPSGIIVNAELSSKVVAMGNKSWNNVSLAAKLADSIVTVNHFTIDLPGQSNLTVFGILAQSSAKDIRFEGSMEAQGKNLKEVLSAFDASIAELPDIGLDNFFVHSNIFISSQQVRLSEADLKIGDLHLNGGLVAYNDERPRVEADIKLTDINFDYFRDAWRRQQLEKDKAAPADSFMKMDSAPTLGWLKQLRTSVDFKIAVERFTFFEKQGDSASFRLLAKDGELGIRNVRFDYPDETMEFIFNINVNGEQPMMDVVFNAGRLDTRYFMVTPPDDAFAASRYPRGVLHGNLDSEDAKKEQWGKTLVDMRWLEGVSGVFDISVGTLLHRGLELGQFKTRAKLEKNLMTLQSLSFDYWNGRFEMLGSVYGGNVPGVALSFTFYNGDMLNIMQELAGRRNITGKISISGSLATSGVNLLSWLNQAEAKIKFKARGVSVNGFNLQNVLKAVENSRTSADVFNNVNRDIIDGFTQMDVEGDINMKNAVLRTPGIALRAEDTVGNLTGDVKLLPWKADLSTFLQFPQLTSETVPTMSVQLAGPIDALEMQTDTSSLEAYVAKRIISK